MKITTIEAQDKINNFIKEHLSICQYHLVENCLNNAFFTYEDADNLFDYEGLLDDDYGDAPIKEILQWVLLSGDEGVTSIFKSMGEVILENQYGVWWGRTQTHMSLENDSVIINLVIRRDPDLKERIVTREVNNIVSFWETGNIGA